MEQTNQTNQYLMIDSDQINQFNTNIARYEMSDIKTKMVSGNETYWLDASARAGLKPYNVIEGVLTIPIQGSLMGDLDINFYGMVTGYGYVKQAYDRAMQDDTVKEVVLDITSGGGHAYSVLELSEYIRKNKTKPLYAVCNSLSCSAAYALAVSADSISAKSSSQIGSIGVAKIHEDYSKNYKNEGIEVTILRKGDKKMQGSYYEPLDEEYKKELDLQLTSMYDSFVALVAESRNLSKEEIYALESRVFTGEEALKLGLIDSISNFNAPQEKQYNGNVKGKNIMEQPEPQVNMQAEIDKASKAAVLAEQTRIAGIMSSDIAKKCMQSAMTLATKTQLSADDIATILSSVEGEILASVPANLSNKLDAAMGQTPNAAAYTQDEPAATDASQEVISMLRASNHPGFRNNKE